MPLFFCFTLDTGMEFLFGESVGALSAYQQANTGAAFTPYFNRGSKKPFDAGALAASKEFSDALRVASDGTIKRLRMGNLYWLVDGLEFRRSIRIVRDFVGGFVEKVLEKVEAEGNAVEGKEQYGLLESLTAQTKRHEDLVSQTLGRPCFSSHFLEAAHID